MYLIIYETNKKNLYRLVSNFPLYEIGDITSMGWKVLDIQVFYKNQFYSYETVHCLIQERKIKELKKEKRKDKILNILSFIKDIIN